MSTFFTSDTHFGHAGIMRWAKRPFATAQQMDEEMIRRWNETVSEDDTVYHLGDFGFHSTAEQLNPILSRLNGHIHLVLGNHDYSPDIESFAYWRITSFQDYLKIRIAGQNIVLCHYPLSEWDGSFGGAWHLYGHAHNQWPTSPWKRLDVGVDGHDFYPWSMEQLKAVMDTRQTMNGNVYK